MTVNNYQIKLAKTQKDNTKGRINTLGWYRWLALLNAVNLLS